MSKIFDGKGFFKETLSVRLEGRVEGRFAMFLNVLKKIFVPPSCLQWKIFFPSGTFGQILLGGKYGHKLNKLNLVY